MGVVYAMGAAAVGLAATEFQSFPHVLPAGATRKGEQVDLYATTAHATANTETLRGAGVTVTAAKTMYITDVWLDLVPHSAGSHFHLYLLAGATKIASITQMMVTSGIMNAHRHLRFITPLSVAAGVVIRFGDKSAAVAGTYSGSVSWSGYEM